MAESSERTAEMLKTALDMEARGREFYTQAASTCHNPYGRAMFQKLLDDEVAHANRIERLYRLVKAGAALPRESDQSDREVDLASFFVELVSKAKQSISAESTDMHALEIGIAFEQNAVRFYESALEATVDPMARQFLDRMLAEERGHVTALSELRDYLLDPAAWFSKHDATIVDG